MSTCTASATRRRATNVWVKWKIPLLAALCVVVSAGWWLVPDALAWHVESETPTSKDYLFMLARSRFGTLVMVFCGFGGFVTLYMQRVGRKGQSLPLVGIGMLLLAIFLFIMRTMITSGLLGAQYLDYGR